MVRGKPITPADYLLLGLFAVWLVFGLVMLTSASAPSGYNEFGDKYFFIKRQLLYGVAPGLLLYLITARLRFSLFRTLAVPAFIVSILLLIAVLIPGIGTTLNTGARSWLQIGGFTMQPAEFAKLGMVLFLAAYLASVGDDVRHITQGFGKVLLFGLVPVLLVVLQPDIGTASILFAILFGMLFVAEADIKHMGGLALLSVIALGVLIVIAPYRTARLTSFLNPDTDLEGAGYQVNQAELAVGSGGFLGLGYGHSRQKFEYLPEVHGDSIFAVVGEEMGFLFAGGLIVLLVVIALRSFRLAQSLKDPFASYVVAGVIIWFMVQSFLNIGGIIGVLPLTGVPLPFVSHGGTALMIAMTSVGIVLNASKQPKRAL